MVPFWFSAPRRSAAVREEAKSRALKVIDATCPLVTKVHLEALKFAREKRTIILTVIGTIRRSSELRAKRRIVPSLWTPSPPWMLSKWRPDKLSFPHADDPKPLRHSGDRGAARQKFPFIQGPASDDICYATQNRQEAVEQVAKTLT